MQGRRGGGSRRGPLIAAAVGVAALAVVATATAAMHAGGGKSTARGAVLAIRKTTLGRVLVDARGRTLYAYGLDRKGKSVCYGSCATAWPPMLVKAKPKAVTGLEAALIATTRRRDGRLQLVYARHPLYTFAFDKKAGAVGGEGYEKQWYALSPAGKVVKSAPKATKTPPPATTTTSSGGDAWG